MAEINERLAHLGTAFSHHLLGDEQDWFMELGEADRDGLSDSFIAAAKAAADERGMAGKAVMTLSRSFVEPFLKSSTRRDLREKVFKAFTARGDNGNANDNNDTIVEILGLREESAKLLGFPTFAAYRLEDSMAKTPEAVRGLLERVWKPARARALADRDALQALVAEEGGNFALAPWDWRFYAEKLRQMPRQFRRRRDQALSRARPHDRRRVRLRASGCSASALSSAAIFRSGIPTSGSGRSRTPRETTRRCSMATILRGPRNAPARG